MDTQVCTLYEFEGDASTGELSFNAGETIVVTNKNVDEGWWEGRKSDGTTGLFPEAYVQEIQAQEQNQMADPFSQEMQAQEQNQMPDPFSQMSSEFPASSSQDPFGNLDPFQQDPFQQSNTNGTDIVDGLPLPPAVSPDMSVYSTASDPFSGVFDDAAPSLQTTTTEDDQYSKEADYVDLTVDDWEESSVSAPVTPISPAQSTTPVASPQTQSMSSDTPAAGSSIKRSGTSRSSSIAKNIFSSFTKTVGTSYVLGEATKANLSNAKKCRIVMSVDGPMWENSPKIFSCTISNPTVSTKYMIKNFIAYEVTASFSKKSVARRYKHFDWLYDQLARKFGVTISIPPLPDKQITGRYEDDFVEGRRAQLETWLSRMGLHPIVSQSIVLQHFLTSHRQEKDWKAGKRKAEKDEVVGGEFLNTIDVPPQHLDLHMSEQTHETHVKFTRNMDEACKQLISIGLEQVKRYTVMLKKDNERIGQTFKFLGDAFELDDREVSQPLTKALKHSGQCYEAIGELYAEQPQCDWNPFLCGLSEYKAVLSTFPTILANQKSAMEKNKEIRRLQGEGKVTFDEMRNAANRTEKLSYAVQAEINHFQHYRVGDFAGYMKDFLEHQIAFHREVMRKLEEAAADYKDMVE